MDRRAWQAIVFGVARAGHDLMTKPQQNNFTSQIYEKTYMSLKDKS